MATIREVIARVDENKPNVFSEALKLRWLALLDGKIAGDVMLMHISEMKQFDYRHPADMDRELLVSFPHDDIYDHWLAAKIDEANGETDKYQNSMEAYNAVWANFVCWFAATYDPAQACVSGAGSSCPPYYLTAYGLAVKEGFRGTLTEWLAWLQGEDGGHYTPSVADNGDGTMMLSFAASKADMPVVAPQRITLPQGPVGPVAQPYYIILYYSNADGNYYTSTQAADILAAYQSGRELCCVVPVNGHQVMLPLLSAQEDGTRLVCTFGGTGAWLTGDEVCTVSAQLDVADGAVAAKVMRLQDGDMIRELTDYISGISVFARFVSSEGYVLSIDTNAMTVHVPDGYVFLKRPKTDPARLTVADTTCAINTESAFSFVVVDVVTREALSINPANFDAQQQVVLAVLWKGNYTNPAANWVFGPYQVNNFLYNAPVEQAVYVSTTGSDSNVGDRNNPFRTINKAVASGAKTIIVFSGTYRESVSASRVGGEIEILAKPISNTNKDVILDLGQELAMSADSITGLVKAAYATTADDFLYKAFVSKSETLVFEDGFISDGYACNLWSGDTKLTPVLTLAECQATAGTWFYDGVNVYANAQAGTFTLADGAADYGIHLSYFKKVKLMGIVVRHAKLDGVRLEGCTDAEISRCKFSHSGLYTGLALNYTSAIVRNCEAMYNRTDGFNIHGVGTADFIDCVSHHNWDDGISHHDESGGMILGGEYYHNGKGGVCSPTFGSRNGINGVYIHDNANGVYAVTDSDGECPRCTVSNCTIVNNTNGVRTSRYELLGWNNALSGNGTDVVEENGGTWTVIGGSSSGGDGYTLPVATPDILGGVKPVTKTDDMTEPVGVDENGGLWAVSSGGGVAEYEMVCIRSIVLSENVSSVDITTDDEGNPFETDYMIVKIHPYSTNKNTKKSQAGYTLYDADSGASSGFVSSAYLFIDTTNEADTSTYTVEHDHFEVDRGLITGARYHSTGTNSFSYPLHNLKPEKYGTQPTDIKKISKVVIWHNYSNCVFGIGTEIQVWIRRAVKV